MVKWRGCVLLQNGGKIEPLFSESRWLRKSSVNIYHTLVYNFQFYDT